MGGGGAPPSSQPSMGKNKNGSSETLLCLIASLHVLSQSFTLESLVCICSLVVSFGTLGKGGGMEADLILGQFVS